jgi:hypothetical protein
LAAAVVVQHRVETGDRGKEKSIIVVMQQRVTTKLLPAVVSIAAPVASAKRAKSIGTIVPILLKF